ncbi:hypothetical protein An02g05270 [Aspergillus niger]|uniref:Uncharacterized protein n=2 Tax=Aspergillus niger TaxID=5061 RepID=A2QCZ3_ASPNC|nr:hypothetical protein An02g05270 [Aspergillus niger]CAK37633.1 hypothetical protein An02g05270 [Aspergillus niger]
MVKLVSGKVFMNRRLLVLRNGVCCYILLRTRHLVWTDRGRNYKHGRKEQEEQRRQIRSWQCVEQPSKE